MLCPGLLHLQVMGKGLCGEHHLCFEIKWFQEVLGGSSAACSLVLYQSHQRQLVLAYLTLSLLHLCEMLKMGWLTTERGKIKGLCNFPSFPSSDPHPCQRKA